MPTINYTYRCIAGHDMPHSREFEGPREEAVNELLGNYYKSVTPITTIEGKPITAAQRKIMRTKPNVGIWADPPCNHKYLK